MAITVQIKPDLSAFREATVDDITELGAIDAVDAEQLLEKFWIIPR